MKKTISIFLFCTLMGTLAFGQTPKRMIKKLGNNPVIFIDSINVTNEDLGKYDPNEIAQVSVYKDEEAKELLGEDGKDGVVYVFTKAFARDKYRTYFGTKSPEYQKLVTDARSDSSVQYILNKRILTKDFEGDLLLINDNIFIEIRFLDKATLEKEYKITNKEFGFQIVSRVPDNLHKGKKKF